MGAVAVLVTLIYLATQVRQNTGALRANAEQTSIKSLRDLHSFLLSDDRLRVFRTGLEVTVGCLPQNFSNSSLFFIFYLLEFFLERGEPFGHGFKNRQRPHDDVARAVDMGSVT